MDLITKMLSASGNSRLREKAKEAEKANKKFIENLGNLKSRLGSEESSDVIKVLDAVYDDSFPEDKVFLKTPSRARLNFKKELVMRLLHGLGSLGVPAMAEMLIFTKNYDPEEIADSLMILLNCLSPLLEGKEAPEYSTDDVINAIDLQWHSPSRKGSPMLNKSASAASPLRYRTMLIPRAQEVSAKSAHDKTFIGASTPHIPKFPAATDIAQSPAAVEVSLIPEDLIKPSKEELLWSKDDEASMQEASEVKDDTLPKEEFNESKRSLDEVDNFPVDTDQAHNVSLNDNVKLEKPELLGEDEKKDNVQPLEGHVEGASEHRAVEENPEVGADQGEKSFSLSDAADEGVFSNGRELPLENEAEAGEWGLDDKTIKEIIREVSARGGQLDSEEMQAIVNEMLSRENLVGNLDSTVQSTDATARGKQVMMEAIARRRLAEYLQLAAEEERANAGSSTVDDATGGDRDMPADFMGPLGDHDNQQRKIQFPLSRKADSPRVDYANLSGHPMSSSSSASIHVDSPRKSDQHVQAPFSDSIMDKWDIIKRSSSKRKGGLLGKWPRNYFQCFSKPPTKSHHKTSSL